MFRYCSVIICFVSLCSINLPNAQYENLNEFQINSNIGGLDTDPNVAALQNGGFMIVWQKDPATFTQLGAQFFDQVGNKVGGEVIVNSVTAAVTAGQNKPGVAVLNDGKIVICWAGQERTISAQSLNEIGNKIGSEFQITDGAIGHNPKVIATPNGFLFVGKEAMVKISFCKVRFLIRTD